MNKPVLQAKEVTKIYGTGDQVIPVLRGINFTIEQGQRIAIVGASGTGKSTLLHVLGGLDSPSSGEVLLNDQPYSRLGEVEQGALRNRYLGFVYQFHHLLPEFSALDNVAMPLWIRRMPKAEAREQAEKILKAVGLGQRLQHAPGELSGGERQRTALARALVTQPACVLADEPTGNLDRATAEAVFEVMLSLNQQFGTALVIVTHDMELATRCDTQLTLKNGLLA
ncbi:MAG: lipoprotein-releasing ABC transporter ATP-binding protein LolD [Burkholderiales bacterium]|jgi:lipoprotein-releasing system ATP-binding protein